VTSKSLIFNAKRRAKEIVIALLAIKKTSRESNRRDYELVFAKLSRVLSGSDVKLNLIRRDSSTLLLSVDRALIRRTKYCDGIFIVASQVFIMQISIRREKAEVLNRTRENDATEVNGETSAV